MKIFTKILKEAPTVKTVHLLLLCQSFVLVCVVFGVFGDRVRAVLGPPAGHRSQQLSHTPALPKNFARLTKRFAQ